MLSEITPDFFFIERDWLNANHFVVRGRSPVLIDTGYARDIDETLAILADLDVFPEAVGRIVLTHTHSDHVGAVKTIQQASGCEVALHPISRHYIDTRNRWATWWHYYDQEADFFETHVSLDDGDRIELGGLSFEVIHAPGHSAGQICLFEPDNGLLISSDALWDGDLGAMTPRIEGMDCVFRALETLDRLAALKPKKVYAGHGLPFEDVSGAIARTRSKLMGFLADPKKQGRDQIKKIVVFTLLMKGGLPAASLFDNLADTPWFNEAISLFFGKERPRPVLDQVVDELIAKGVLTAEGAFLKANSA
jgi:glyoxylase-like metal-dependent hydrolase (beta-lactamase superfamily II)